MNTENNKIIAEFMGMKENSFTGAFKNVDNKFLFPSELVYHSDWNWLMEVVEKIESLGYWINRINGNVYIQDNNYKTVASNTERKEGKEAVYNAVVAFIKWNNQILASKTEKEKF